MCSVFVTEEGGDVHRTHEPTADDMATIRRKYADTFRNSGGVEGVPYPVSVLPAPRCGVDSFVNRNNTAPGGGS